MVSKAQKFRMGLFVLICSVMLIVFLVSVAGTKLLEKRDTYYIHYKNVSVIGLQVGGSVKYFGISIGRVDDISIDPDNIERIIVEISIKAGTPIKEDLEATLSPVGITGLMQIELSGGSNEAKTVPPGSVINPGESFFQSITSKAEAISEKIDDLLSNFVEMTNPQNLQKLNNIIDNVDFIIEDSRQPIGNILVNADSTVVYMNSIASDLAKTIAQVNEIVLSDKANIFEALEQFNLVLQNANSVIEHIDITVLNSQQDLKITIDTMREVMDNLNDFTRQLNEDPTILWRTRRQ